VLVSMEEFLEYLSPEIKIVFEPYPKKSLLKRLYFERFIIPDILKEEKADAYLSLQNTSLYKGLVPQFVLIQQSLHFAELKFWQIELKNIIKYRFLMDLFTRVSINNYSGLIVQTNWVKEAVKKRYGYKGEIKVIRPSLMSFSKGDSPLDDDVLKVLHTNRLKLLYVTRVDKYKNNKLAIEAVKAYNSNIEDEKKVVLFLTIDGSNENDIKYLGKVHYSAINNLYKSVDVLVFPSLCETLGLPLMEAMKANLPVLAADLPYAREVCGDNALYFQPDSVNSLKNAIGDFVKTLDKWKGESCHSSVSDGLGVEKQADNILTKDSSYLEYIVYIYNKVKGNNSITL
jgi:glycosyltransferase involved in cell wall biosynthesis